VSFPVTGGQVEGLVKDQFALRHLTTQSETFTQVSELEVRQDPPGLPTR